MQTLSARQGESLDAICYRFYGHSEHLEAVLNANPALAECGPILPEGTQVLLPAYTGAATLTATINLWD